MKKSYLMMAAAATMLAACTQTDLVQEVNTQQAITFEGFAGKTTRAEITEVDDLKEEGVGFKVWGYYGAAADFTTPAATVFDEVNVTWTDGAWKTAVDRYWNSEKYYKFYAAAPSTGSYTMVDEETGFIEIENVVSAPSADSKDYLITRGATVQTGSAKPVVALDFHHTMAKVTVEVKRTTASVITVTDITMTGWNNSAGVFEQNSATTPNSLECTEWTQNGTAAGSADFLGTTPIVLNTDAAAPAETTWIFVPQTIPASTLEFTIKYTIDGTEYTKDGVIAAGHTWGTDSHTTYTISIGEPLIQFAVNSVCGWENEGTGGTTITN